LLADLQQQLASGKKVDTYGELGLQRVQVLSLRSELSQIKGFTDGISMIDLRLDSMLLSLERIRELASETKSDALEVGFEPLASGLTVYQTEVSVRFDEVAALLNTEVNGRHLFGGRETEQDPVLPSAEILDGSSGRAGFRQIASERRLADIGADGRGRLVLNTPAGATATISEDAAGSPFGFKLAGVTSTLSGTTVTGPAGAPPDVDITFSAALPKDGETIHLTFDLPDGTQHELTMTARASGPLAPGEFLIGADENATAANFQTALTSEVETEAQRSLSAASLFAAANNFFDFDAANPPQRVNGPPFDSATSLRDATAADTVFWYRGEDSATSARQSSLARVDDAISVAYGARANEQSLRDVLKAFAAVSVETFNPSDADAADRYHELKLRANAILSFPAGTQGVDDIITELTVAKTVAGRAGERHEASGSILQGIIGEAENADILEVGTQILELQTRIEASLQISASLGRLSILNFI
jgi:flagellin-like hook-associated protein FlgL